MTKATTWVAECCHATPPAFLRGAAKKRVVYATGYGRGARLAGEAALRALSWRPLAPLARAALAARERAQPRQLTARAAVRRHLTARVAAVLRARDDPRCVGARLVCGGGGEGVVRVLEH